MHNYHPTPLDILLHIQEGVLRYDQENPSRRLPVEVMQIVRAGIRKANMEAQSKRDFEQASSLEHVAHIVRAAE